MCQILSMAKIGNIYLFEEFTFEKKYINKSTFEGEKMRKKFIYK